MSEGQTEVTKTEDKGWVWSTLERMADIAVQQEEAEQEAKRLASVYAGERERVAEAVPDLSIDGAIQAIRVLGTPPRAGSAQPDPVQPADSASPEDPLVIPDYLKRTPDSGGGDDRGTLQNDAEVLARTAPT